MQWVLLNNEELQEMNINIFQIKQNQAIGGVFNNIGYLNNQ